MNGPDYRVSPKSKADIERLAWSIRDALDLTKVPRFPVIEVIEQVLGNEMDLFSFEVLTFDEMEGAEGLSCPDGNFIRIREDVYTKACRGDPRARLTVCHELGHNRMHRLDRPGFRRVEAGINIKAYESAEWQASYFAGALLAPAKHHQPDDTVVRLMTRHGLSQAAAEVRLKQMRSLR